MSEHTAPAPQGPDIARIDALLAASVAYRAACELELAALQAAQLTAMASADAEVRAANEAVLSAAESIRTPARLTSAEQALIEAALAYAAHHAQPGTTKTTTATEQHIDAVLAACRRLAEEK